MTITEYISALEAIRSEHGDLQVQTAIFDGRRVDMRAPSVDYTLVLRGREWKPRFFPCYEKDETRRGELVCRV